MISFKHELINWGKLFYLRASNNELLVWGSNKNYNLGINDDQDTDHLPRMLNYFRKEQISIQLAALGAYHSLFLDKKSNLYTVGHGKGGRLGKYKIYFVHVFQYVYYV